MSLVAQEIFGIESRNPKRLLVRKPEFIHSTPAELENYELSIRICIYINIQRVCVCVTDLAYCLPVAVTGTRYLEIRQYVSLP